MHLSRGGSITVVGEATTGTSAQASTQDRPPRPQLRDRPRLPLETGTSLTASTGTSVPATTGTNAPASVVTGPCTTGTNLPGPTGTSLQELVPVSKGSQDMSLG